MLSGYIFISCQILLNGQKRENIFRFVCLHGHTKRKPGTILIQENHIGLIGDPINSDRTGLIKSLFKKACRRPRIKLTTNHPDINDNIESSA